jgi:hypothetical protein
MQTVEAYEDLWSRIRSLKENLIGKKGTLVDTLVKQRLGY